MPGLMNDFVTDDGEVIAPAVGGPDVLICLYRHHALGTGHGDVALSWLSVALMGAAAGRERGRWFETRPKNGNFVEGLPGWLLVAVRRDDLHSGWLQRRWRAVTSQRSAVSPAP